MDLIKENSVEESCSGDDSDDESFVMNESDSSDEEMEINESVEETEIINTSVNTTAMRQIENSPITSQNSTKRNRHFCIYCKCLIVNLPRHLESVHANIPDVREFLWLPKLCPERKKLIDKIRKQGDFQFNTNVNYNNGQVIVCRKSTAIKGKCFEDYVACPHCKGFISKNSLYRHYRLCDPKAQKGVKNVLLRGKKITGRWHHVASSSLTERVLPSFRDDDISKIVRYDYLIILFGNKLCDKYKSQHLNKYIRQILRTLGRLLKSIKLQSNLVTDFASVFNPRLYDSIILAVNDVAGLSATTAMFMKPTLAANIGTYIKKCGKLLITQCIKNEDLDRMKTVENFLKIFEEDYATAVNKTAIENRNECRRQKSIELPCTKDIECLINHLYSEQNKVTIALENDFNYINWIKLAKCCLSYIQIFNRRRAGETERILLTDFEKHHTIDKENDPDLYQNLNAKAQNSAHNFVRMQIRGKLGRTVSVLLQKQWLQSLLLIVKYRTEAGVSRKNPYLFGIPGGATNHNHLTACDLLRTFAYECGAKKPETLRGTLLRKHFATVVQNLNLNDADMALVANFMGHDEKIHRSHYRLPIVAKEIGQMSHLLQVVESGHINKYRGQNLDEMCNKDVLKITDANSVHETEIVTSSEEEIMKICKEQRCFVLLNRIDINKISKNVDANSVSETEIVTISDEEIIKKCKEQRCFVLVNRTDIDKIRNDVDANSVHESEILISSEGT